MLRHTFLNCFVRIILKYAYALLPFGQDPGCERRGIRASKPSLMSHTFFTTVIFTLHIIINHRFTSRLYNILYSRCSKKIKKLRLRPESAGFAIIFLRFILFIRFFSYHLPYIIPSDISIYMPDPHTRPYIILQAKCNIIARRRYVLLSRVKLYLYILAYYCTHVTLTAQH